jgi:hypothetical protein
VLRKLCLPFSPYRQRPDITLHGREASRTAIPAQGPSDALTEVRRVSRPESGPVSYQITIPSERFAGAQRASEAIAETVQRTAENWTDPVAKSAGSASSMRIPDSRDFRHGSSEHAGRLTPTENFAACSRTSDKSLCCFSNLMNAHQFQRTPSTQARAAPLARDSSGRVRRNVDTPGLNGAQIPTGPESASQGPLRTVTKGQCLFTRPGFVQAGERREAGFDRVWHRHRVNDGVECLQAVAGVDDHRLLLRV